MLLLLSFAIATDAVADAGTWSPRIQRLTVAEGLPDQTVFSVQRDRRGFLWFGTTAGAVRYDGRRFVSLRHDPDDPNSLSHDNASLVFVDSRGLLWVGTWGGGLNRVDLDSGKVRRWLHAPDDPDSLASDYVQGLFEDSRGRMWIGTGAGLVGVRGDTTFRAYTAQEGSQALGGRRVWSIAETQDGRLWVATSDGLVEFEPDSGRHRIHRPALGAALDAQSGNDDSLVRLVHVDAKGRLWIANGLAFGRYHPDTREFQGVAMPSGFPSGRLTVNTALAMDARHVWLGTWSGVWLLDADRAELVPIGRSGLYHWFPADDVRGLLPDSSGALWAATRYNGVARIELSAPRIRLYRHELQAVGSDLGSSLVRAVYAHGGKLWLNTDGALMRADLDRGEFDALPATRGLRVGRYGPNAFTSDGDAWLATLYGPARLRLPDGQLEMVPGLLAAAGVRDSNLTWVRRDRDGRLWWATQREGLFVSDEQGRLLRRYTAESGRDGELPDPAPLGWLQDRSGRIWIASESGLARLEHDESGFVTFRHDPRDIASLSHSRVLCMLEDESGRLWFGTQVGLDRWDEQKQGFVRHPLPDGGRLPVEAIAEGREGELWLASAGRLQHFDAAQGRFVGPPVDVGEPGIAFFTGAALRLDPSRLLFGTNRGLLVFDPLQERSPPILPEVAITAAWIDRQPVPLPPGGVIERTLRLPPGAQTLELELAALDLRHPARNRYGYRLEGFDPDWIDAGAHGRITYTNLAPGSYRLLLRAAGADQVWNDSAASLSIDVLPPWWRETRMQIGAALALAVLLWLGLHLHVRRVRRRESELERLLAERSAQVATQQQQLAVQDKMASLGTLTAGVAHEINNPTNFVFAGAQNLDVELDEFRRDLRQLAGDDVDPGVLEFFARRFATLGDHIALIRDGAERIRGIVGHLQSFSRRDEDARQRASVDDGLRATLALVRAKYGDEVRFELALGDCPAFDCRPAELNQVFMNLLVNACQAAQARHGREGAEVRLASRWRGNECVVEISDNGNGIAPADLSRIFEPFFTTKAVGEGSGLGLSISYAIVERHGGRIEVESERGVGTCMRVRLPTASGG